jgi:hypothetical protein
MTRGRIHVQRAQRLTICDARSFETPGIRSTPAARRRIPACNFPSHQSRREARARIAEHAAARCTVRPRGTVQGLKSPHESALSTLDPDPDRAVLLDRRLRERLGASLRYVLGEAAAPLALAPSALDGFLSRLQSAPVRPAAFGAYFELVTALERQHLTAAKALLLEIAAAPNHAARITILDLSETDSPSRYRRLLSGDSELPLRLVAPPHALSQSCRRLIDEAFALLDHGDPTLAAEIRQLVREVVLVDSDDQGPVSFEGASSFMLWGAVTLNARVQYTSLQMVQALVHESGHNLLFGLCANGPLVSGEDAARYASPLRSDLRPMDGIVHATFVSARMHRAVATLLNAGSLPFEQLEAAQSDLATHARNCERGLQTIEGHGRLTALGETVCKDVQRYLSASRRKATVGSLA